MCRKNVLLVIACLFVELHHVQASVIIKAVPHANVKMEFGAHHVSPHDVALQDESAKVDGTTRLGIEVPHSHNHRNVLIHKIGTYLTVVMKALAKTVAPAQNQDGKTHFDIHVDADLGENDRRHKHDESPQFTIVQSKHGEAAEQSNGDSVKAVVIVSESEGNDNNGEHNSSEQHSMGDHHEQNSHQEQENNTSESDEDDDEHRSSDSRRLQSSDSRECNDSHRQDSEEQGSEGDEKKKSLETHPKIEHKKKDSHLVFHYNSEDTKESKDHHKQNINVLEEKIQISKEPFKFEPPKDWESFKRTQDMLKEKGFILQLDKSFFHPKENHQKSPQKAKNLDVKSKIKIFLEGKSLSQEEMEESERDSKSLELTEADPEEMLISMINSTDRNSRYQDLSENNETYTESPSYSKTQTVNTSAVQDVSTGGKQIQTVKTTYQSGPVIVTTTKLVTEVPSNGSKTVSYEMVKQTSIPEKLNPAEAEVSPTANEIPSHVLSHFQQTSYSSDRSRSMTIVSKDPIVDLSKGAISQPVVLEAKDKPNILENSKTVPHLKNHDESSREVIMRLAPASKTGLTKNAQIIDVKIIKTTKSDIIDEEKPDGTLSRQEGIRKLPMANIPTLIDVLQKSPPQEVQRLTQLASGGSSQESQRETSNAEDINSPVAPIKIRDPVPSKSPREYQLPELHLDEVNSEERKGLTRSIEDLESFVPHDYNEASETARNETLHAHSQEIHTSKEDSKAEVPSSEYPDGASKGLDTTKKSNIEDNRSAKGLDATKKSNIEDNKSAEELGSLKAIPENTSNPESMEVIISTEPDKQQKELIIDSLKNDDENVQNNTKDSIDHEGGRSQKAFNNDVMDLEKDKKSSVGSSAIAIEDIGNDPRASHAFSLSSLTASAEEARALDISSSQVEKQATEFPVASDFPIEDVAASPGNLNQDDKSPQQGVELSDTAEHISEMLRQGRNVTSPSQSEETEHKEESITDKPPFIEDKAVSHGESKEVAPSDIHNVPSVYDDSSYVISPATEPSTTPSLPEKESMDVPIHKERELNLDDDPIMPVTNLVEINEVPVDDDREGRIFESELGSSSLLSPLSATVPEASVSDQDFSVSNAIHDPNSPFIYSYYPPLHPKGAHTLPNKTADTQGLYGRPSPRVICVNTDTGKLLNDSPTTDDHSNAVTRYSPKVLKSSKEDDKLMLLKLLHEDIQKLKQQLKIQ